MLARLLLKHPGAVNAPCRAFSSIEGPSIASDNMSPDCSLLSLFFFTAKSYVMHAVQRDTVMPFARCTIVHRREENAIIAAT